ncbi:hypothetical protein RUM43_010294 [Polyplax serrata]|uniref:non-specific serine/threonine protein kinase n=1 Tax=Polyplax serrata TaxID=468196 RepID=A0AAN8PKN3_POLSC
MAEECKVIVIHSRSASQASTTSTFSSQCDGDGDASQVLNNVQNRRTSKIFGTPTRKAKRIRFFRNGDRFFKGVVMPVTPERYRSFDSLLSDVTHTLKDHVNLPNGVRAVYTLEGNKVSDIDDLEDGKCYVCSGQGEPFKRIEYLNLSSRKVKPGKPFVDVRLDINSPRTPKTTSDFIRPKVIILIRNGTRPRKVIRLLLNKRNARSFEHALSSITEAVKLDTGAVRKVYNLVGSPIFNLQQFFEFESVFFVYGSERFNQDDLHLDPEEQKAVQAHKKNGSNIKRSALLNEGNRSARKTSMKRALNQSNDQRESEPVVPSKIGLKYKIGKIIGDGNFAVVRQCVDRLYGKEYAVKIIDKSKWKGEYQIIENEVEILRKVNHPNIIKLLDEYDMPSELYLVMELEEGDLFDVIASSKKFPEDESRLMIKHLSSALAYLHNRRIVHRDIKPENLLVRLDENKKVRSVKLGDFGLAQVVTEPLYSVCGTPTYVAPEILSETGYELKVDVWAAGVLLYILLCGYAPFRTTSNDQEELFDKILTGEFEFNSPYWDEISSSSKNLIYNMLQRYPEVRYSAEDVLNHPWLMVGGDSDADDIDNSNLDPKKQTSSIKIETSRCYEIDRSRSLNSNCSS